MPAIDLSLYVILDPDLCMGRSVVDVARGALQGGATVLQLRAKRWRDRETMEVARTLARLAREASAGFVLNDRADLAIAVGASGVHLGPEDLPVDVVRDVLGDKPMLIGASARTPAMALAAQSAGADYLGVGALYDARGAKPDASSPRGPGWIAKVRAAGVRLPIVGIGGIDASNAEEVMRHGANGVAVIRAVCAADDPAEAARVIRVAVERGRA